VLGGQYREFTIGRKLDNFTIQKQKLRNEEETQRTILLREERM
jgi:hypothetical protein